MKRFLSSLIAIIIGLSVSGCGPKEPEPTEPPAIPFTSEEFIKVDGSTVTIPLTVAFAQATLGVSHEEASRIIKHNTTHNAYVNLIEGKADIIFATYPSEEELNLAKEKGVELEIVPVVNDAFIFLVNKENPVNGLTTEQIRNIYSGKITNWNKVGGENVTIKAFQREENSGSQTGMKRLVMKGTPLMKAQSDYMVGDMGGLIEQFGVYSNARSAIGYSYYYYVNNMYIRETVKLLAVDGVVPSNETITANEYPYVTPYYAVIHANSEENSFARRLLNYSLTNDAQTLAEENGYVRAKI